jgi:hypothetical protein
MRRFIFLLMIALLPLQGWTSVAMSTEMATMQLFSTQSHSAVASMNMSPECALRMSHASSQNAKNDDASNQVCSDCQACHLIALAESVHIVSKATFSVSFERPARHYFASADLQLSQKPPIFSA